MDRHQPSASHRAPAGGRPGDDRLTGDQVDATDETYWSGIRDQFSPSADFINLENGLFGLQPKSVLEAFQRYTVEVNQQAAFFLRRQYPERHAAVLRRLTAFTGSDDGELLITRNVTEAMNILIQGYPLSAGDEVVLHDQDYPSMVAAFEMMRRRRDIQISSFRFPLLPHDDEEILALYDRAITSRTRLILLTHMIHTTGQIVPVAKIARMARARKVDVLVDAAHSFAQLDYRFADLGADFIATNLHKWLGAPLGLGLLYIRRDRVGDIAPLFGDTTYAETDIRKLGHFGVTPPASVLAIEDAIAFHEAVGARNKEIRLRYLKDYWVSRVRDLGAIEMLTPAGSDRSCAIAAFRVAGRSGKEVVDYLFDQHRILTVERDIDGATGVRVTPHLYTSIEQLDRLVAALERL
jgi:selenocysteine lyase/cysteine desulfurase